MDSQRITDLDSVPADSTFLFRVRPRDDGAVADTTEPNDGTDATADFGEQNGDTDATADSGDQTTSTDATADTDGLKEAILLSTDDGVVCWLNYCQHFTHITLDKGSGASIRNDEIVCENHGAMFDVDTGECTFGPCEGAYLNDVAVTIKDGNVYLTDERYEYVGPGPIDDGDDLTSTSNVEF